MTGKAKGRGACLSCGHAFTVGMTVTSGAVRQYVEGYGNILTYGVVGCSKCVDYNRHKLMPRRESALEMVGA
jgi:hypothetical protein